MPIYRYISLVPQPLPAFQCSIYSRENIQPPTIGSGSVGKFALAAVDNRRY